MYGLVVSQGWDLTAKTREPGTPLDNKDVNWETKLRKTQKFSPLLVLQERLPQPCVQTQGGNSITDHDSLMGTLEDSWIKDKGTDTCHLGFLEMTPSISGCLLEREEVKDTEGLEII